MTDFDWTAPKNTEPTGSGPEWKVDEDPRSHFDSGIYIYAVPAVGSIRKIATVERKDDAELIVFLYEKHRRGT